MINVLSFLMHLFIESALRQVQYLSCDVWKMYCWYCKTRICLWLVRRISVLKKKNKLFLVNRLVPKTKNSVLENQPTVQSVGVSRGRGFGCGYWRWWQVTGGAWHMTHDIWLVTDKIVFHFSLNMLSPLCRIFYDSRPDRVSLVP